MSEKTRGVRGLAGTRKVAFVLTSDAKRKQWEYCSADAGDNWSPIVRDFPPVLSVEVQTL